MTDRMGKKSVTLYIVSQMVILQTIKFNQKKIDMRNEKAILRLQTVLSLKRKVVRL